MQSENRIQKAFACIKAEEELKTSTKEFLQTARCRNKEKAGHGRAAARVGFSPALRQLSVMACAVLLLICGISFHIMFRVPVSYVSIDVNPSIELELNRLDRVISAKAYNEDGEIVLRDISVTGKYYTDAIDLILENSSMQPYLTGNIDLVFTVASGNGEREAELMNGIRNSSGCVKHGGRSVEGDMELADEAHDNGFSLGKYTACKILQQYDSSVTISDCHDMSMAEIHSRIEEHEGNHDEHGSDSHESDGHGTEGHEPDSHESGGYGTEGHEPDSHESGGYGVEGCEPDSHESGGYEIEGHEPGNYGVEGHESGSYGTDGHEPDGYETDSYRSDGHGNYGNGTREGDKSPENDTEQEDGKLPENDTEQEDGKLPEDDIKQEDSSHGHNNGHGHR